GTGRPLPRLTIDQSHNIEAKVEAMVMSVVNIQDAYARALIVDLDALRTASAEGDVLAGHQALLDAYNTDVRPLCASARRALGAADDPIGALRASGRYQRIAEERGGTA
ncbi:MAG: L-rhamnose isomerase / sugar isomerase, partial [Gaiellales bacterium]|nr:L-rhamnose isomerase / sugar isomerase [Gaiellales bacterium]